MSAHRDLRLSVDTLLVGLLGTGVLPSRNERSGPGMSRSDWGARASQASTNRVLKRKSVAATRSLIALCAAIVAMSFVVLFGGPT